MTSSRALFLMIVASEMLKVDVRFYGALPKNTFRIYTWERLTSEHFLSHRTQVIKSLRD
jgi:hypothetical protein